MSDHANTIHLLRKFADALDADRGHPHSLVTRTMREVADLTDALLAEYEWVGELNKALNEQNARLVAERQQAQEQAEGWRQTNLHLIESRQQAIEALRKIGTECEMAPILAELERAEKNCREAYTREQWCPQCVAADALAKFGETP